MDDFFKEPGQETGNDAEVIASTDEELIEDPEELESLDDESSPLAGNDGEGPEESIDSRLARLERERDEAQSVLARQEQARQQQAAQQYWQQSKNQADAYFAAQESKIYQEAQNAYDPAAFVRQRMAGLNKARNEWNQQYFASRENTFRQAIEQMAVPGYASEVARHYGLGDGEAQQLLRFHPDQMPAIAEMLADAKGVSPQQARRQAAQYMSGSIAPGGSRSSGGRKIKAGSDAHLVALFKSGQG